MSVDSISSVNGPTTTSIGAISRVSSGHSTPSRLDELKEKQNFGEDNIFAANFGGIESKGLEETSGTLACNNEPSGNLFEESAGQLAYGDMKDFQLEESAGQLAQGGLNLVA